MYTQINICMHVQCIHILKGELYKDMQMEQNAYVSISSLPCACHSKNANNLLHDKFQLFSCMIVNVHTVTTTVNLLYNGHHWDLMQTLSSIIMEGSLIGRVSITQ